MAPCHEAVFQKLKDRFCHDIASAFPNTDYPFHIHADSSNVGTGCILIQAFPDGKKIISANSRVFDKAEQKMHHSIVNCVVLYLLFKHLNSIL